MTTGRGLIVAAPSSNSGKTIVTLGLLRSLRRGGHRIGSAKVGPDYIDPAYHAAATGSECVNLDPWAMRPSSRQALVRSLEENFDLIICEGVMGLFDGATANAGSTADVAAETGWPIILVVDARAQAGSAAALLRGFATHRTDVRVEGVIFNRIGSKRHASVIEEACEQALPEIPILGFLPRDDRLTLADRHLGLIQAIEHPTLSSFLDGAADVVDEHLDLVRLENTSRTSHIEMPSNDAHLLDPIGQRIAIASDAAFAFCYPSVLCSWQAAGAECALFSPLSDEAPDTAADSVYLPGGYPELYAGALAGSFNFLNGLRKAAQKGAAVFGECGGYMALGEALIAKDGTPHEMAGLLPLTTSFTHPVLHLGYRRMTLAHSCSLGPVGTAFRGHEFHYASIVSEGPSPALFSCENAAGEQLGFSGLARGNVCGSFLHMIDRDNDGDETDTGSPLTGTTTRAS